MIKYNTIPNLMIKMKLTRATKIKDSLFDELLKSMFPHGLFYYQ